MNLGLLDPLDLCRRAEAAYRAGHVPLNAAEGFIRQIIGWREYIRGMYWLKMPAFADANALGATVRCPSSTGRARPTCVCLADAVATTRDHAYAHHIQRLMVLGNFAMLPACTPTTIDDWFLVVYADAYEWVELPNVHGMATYADGGVSAPSPMRRRRLHQPDERIIAASAATT